MILKVTIEMELPDRDECDDDRRTIGNSKEIAMPDTADTETVDPRINCAAEICCGEDDARKARVEMLSEMGVEPLEAIRLADEMKKKGLAFMPVRLTQVIAEIADHPGRAAANHGNSGSQGSHGGAKPSKEKG